GRRVGVVERAVAVQAGDVAPGGVVEQVETPDHDHATVLLQRLRLDKRVLIEGRIERARSGIEGGIKAAVGIEPGNTATAGAARLGEKTGDQEPRVRLHLNGKNVTVKTGGEGGVQAAVLGLGRGGETNEQPDHHEIVQPRNAFAHDEFNFFRSTAVTRAPEI